MSITAQPTRRSRARASTWRSSRSDVISATDVAFLRSRDRACRGFCFRDHAAQDVVARSARFGACKRNAERLAHAIARTSPRRRSLGGDAPWALSALPDCARQHSEDRGNAATIRAKIPSDATAVDGRVHAGPCTIDVTADGIFVRRGSDRLRIPPPARLLYWDDRYYLYEEDRKGAILRVYTFLQ